MTIDTKSLRDLLSRATAGEWTAQVGKDGAFTVEAYAPGLRVVCSRTPWEHRADESAANGHLIAAAKNSMGALLDAYEERERLREAARDAWLLLQNTSHLSTEGERTRDKLRAALKEPSHA